MPKCAACGTFIVMGGVTDNGMRFCNEKCHQQGFLQVVAEHVAPELVEEQAAALHQGPCPKCGKANGPVDIHHSHYVWSALVMTSWGSTPHLCCRSCAVKAKLGGALLSGVAGWWGFPWGLIATPIQVGRNLVGVFSAPDPSRPSEALRQLAVNSLAARIADENRQAPEA